MTDELNFLCKFIIVLQKMLKIIALLPVQERLRSDGIVTCTSGLSMAGSVVFNTAFGGVFSRYSLLCSTASRNDIIDALVFISIDGASWQLKGVLVFGKSPFGFSTIVVKEEEASVLARRLVAKFCRSILLWLESIGGEAEGEATNTAEQVNNKWRCKIKQVNRYKTHIMQA